MKNTGKKINGIPLYTDPDCPPDTFYLLNEQFDSKPTTRIGMFRGKRIEDLTEQEHSQYIDALIQAIPERHRFPVEDEITVRVSPRQSGKLTSVAPRPKMIRRLLFHFQRKHEHKVAWWRDHEDLM